MPRRRMPSISATVIIEAGEDGLIAARILASNEARSTGPGSEYFDVLLTFFDPNDRLGRAPLRARFTIDVSRHGARHDRRTRRTWYEY